MSSPKYPWERPLWENTLLPFIPPRWPKGGSDKSQSTFPQLKPTVSQGPSLVRNQTSPPHHLHPARSRGWHSMPLGSQETQMCPVKPSHSTLGRHRALSLHSASWATRGSGPQRASTGVPTLRPAPPLGCSSLTPLCFTSRLLKTFRPSSKVFSILNLAQ